MVVSEVSDLEAILVEIVFAVFDVTTVAELVTVLGVVPLIAVAMIYGVYIPV